MDQEMMPKPHDTVENDLLLDEIRDCFARLRPDQQVQVLADIALFVCFQAREHGSPEPEHFAMAHKQLCAMNELQMLLVKQIARSVASQERLQIPQAFIDQLFQEANNAGLRSKLASAFHHCLPEVS